MPNSRPVKPAHRRGKRPGGRDRRTSEGPGRGNVYLYGLHAVAAALGNPRRRITRLLVTENAAHTLAGPIEARDGLMPEIVVASEIDKLIGGNAVHQGALLLSHPLDDVDLSMLAPPEGGSAPVVVILDQVTDPHNVGAILRSAAVYGVCGLVMTRRHSAPLGEVTAKVASGGLEHARVVLVNNLARAIRDIRRLGYPCHRSGWGRSGGAQSGEDRWADGIGPRCRGHGAEAFDA